MNLNRRQFLCAVERGQTLFKELKADYPKLKLIPVFSRIGLGSEQCELTVDFLEIFKEFPGMLLESADTKLLLRLLWEIKQAKKGEDKNAVKLLQKENQAVQKRLLDPNLVIYCGDTLIEYRPSNILYEPLRQLQQDARLPPDMNEVGSIRVVAGSLEFLVRDHFGQQEEFFGA